MRVFKVACFIEFKVQPRFVRAAINAIHKLYFNLYLCYSKCQNIKIQVKVHLNPLVKPTELVEVCSFTAPC